MKFGKILLGSILVISIFTNSAFAEDRVSLGFMYGWSGNIDLIDRTNGGINQVSPTCLDLTNAGDLYVTSNLTHDFVTKMHERGVKVTPFLSNHWARRKGVNAIRNYEALSDQIVAVIEEYDLDGVNVDIENLLPENKDELSNFVIFLNSKMPEEKILSVSVAANPTGKDTGWQGSYDYAVLGENSDYIFLMAYDEHSQGGPMGPVASYDFVENSIIYALEYVEKDKLVLGIPLFGRYWRYDEETGEYSGGKAIVMGAVQNLFDKIGGIMEYDENLHETRYEFHVDNGIIPVSINAETLEDGDYVVWYSSNDDIKRKLALINQYDLLGSGVWALGQEKAEVWDYYKYELNKTPWTPKLALEEEPLELIETKYEYAAQTVDLTPINVAIENARNLLILFSDLDLETMLAENIQYKEYVPHIHEEFFDIKKYLKVLEELQKDDEDIDDVRIAKAENKGMDRYKVTRIW